jgi:hypothetical protein
MLQGEQAQVDWALCRARHSAHYAGFRTMPSSRIPALLRACERPKILGIVLPLSRFCP